MTTLETAQRAAIRHGEHVETCARHREECGLESGDDCLTERGVCTARHCRIAVDVTSTAVRFVMHFDGASDRWKGAAAFVV